MIGMYLIASSGSVRSAGSASVDQSSCQRLVLISGRLASSSARAGSDPASRQEAARSVAANRAPTVPGFDAPMLGHLLRIAYDTELRRASQMVAIWRPHEFPRRNHPGTARSLTPCDPT